jgi:hypothetical protein
MRHTWANKKALETTGFCLSVLPLDFSVLMPSSPVSQLSR